VSGAWPAWPPFASAPSSSRTTSPRPPPPLAFRRRRSYHAARTSRRRFRACSARFGSASRRARYACSYSRCFSRFRVSTASH